MKVLSFKIDDVVGLTTFFSFVCSPVMSVDLFCFLDVVQLTTPLFDILMHQA